MNVAMTSIEMDVLELISAESAPSDLNLNDTLRRVLHHMVGIRVDLEAVDVSAKHTSVPKKRQSKSKKGTCRYELLGVLFEASSAKDAYRDILGFLQDLDDDFLEQLASSVKGARINHLSRTKEGVRPFPDQRKDRIELVSPGWYFDANISNSQKIMFLRKACKVAGLTFCDDLKLGAGW